MPRRLSHQTLPQSASTSSVGQDPLADFAQFLSLLGGREVLPSELIPAFEPGGRHPARRTPAYYRVRVDLDGARPPIWRRLNLASELTLGQVHQVLQAAFEWYGGHLHEFSLGVGLDAERFLGDFQVEDGDAGTPEDEVRLDEVLAEPGDKLSYWYDFGDDWWHTIKLEAVEPRPDDAPLASVLTGRRAAPPDDCGGIWGYESLLEAITDPTHPEHEELSSWFVDYGGGSADFDPAHLDVDKLDRRVRAVLG